MVIDTPFIIYSLIICNALLLGAATIAVLRLQQYIDRSAAFWESPTGAAVKAESDAESAAVARFETELRCLQRKVEEISRRPPTSHTTVIQDLPIDNAVRMARGGAGVEDLQRACGLNSGEAQLLMKLHSSRARAESTLS